MLVPAPRIERFEKMGFGMFVHWGLYSQIGRGEWYFNNGEMPMEEYEKLKDTFTAEDFDAEALVLMAKNAGCKYITLTTRHHEGFSLYDTKGINDFDAPHSAAKRDLIREFVDACNKYDIMPVFYHTTLDWYNKDFNENFDEYLEYLRKSVEVLCTNYGKIGGLWFDGNWSKKEADWKLDDLYGTIRKHQPDALIINNTGLSHRGEIGHPEIDSVTFERGRPTPMDRTNMSKYVTAEMCTTVSDLWGYGKLDLNYKSPGALIECLCDCRKVGANLLLNIGPMAQGAIHPMQKAIFGIIGDWMNIFGEAIYDVKPYVFREEDKNFIVKGDGCLYIFDYKNKMQGDANVVKSADYCGFNEFIGVVDKIESIEWMDNHEQLKFEQEGDKLTIDLTSMAYGKGMPVRVAKAILAK